MTSEATQVGTADEHEPVSGTPLQRRRRAVLSVLADAGAPLAEADVAVELARRGYGADDTFEAARRLKVTLYHRDLPKLDDAGLVDHDPDRHVVEFTGESVPDADLGRW